MARNYTVNTRIARPVADVFDAIVKRGRLRRYFIDEASGDLEEGEVVTWHWDQWGDFRVTVRRVVPNQRIELVLNSIDWKKSETDGYDVTVVFEFEQLDNGTTRLSISEAGWKTDPVGLKASHENCEGWTHMAMCLKAYIEHAIDLR